MLDTLDEPLSQELIKQFHYELKSGVFEDRANGYAIVCIFNHNWHNPIFQTLSKKNQSACSAIPILERMNALIPSVKFSQYRNVHFLIIIEN